MRYSPHQSPITKAGAICKGAALGLLIGLASIATSDEKTLAILQVVGKPVEWVMWVAQKLFGLGDASTALMGWLGMGIWCMILGGLIGWGVGKVIEQNE
jgi:hypothetical protein